MSNILLLGGRLTLTLLLKLIWPIIPLTYLLHYQINEIRIYVGK